MRLDNSTSLSWFYLLSDVYFNGRPVNPRGKETREILGRSMTINMNNPVVCVRERKLGYHFMAAEAAWIMSGDNRVKTIAPFSKMISNFSDDGERFFGAYGPRIIDQVGHIVKSLVNDRESRQAVLTIWRQNPPITKDVPCTISAQWMIREDKLHCFLNMRSSDAWMGVPYDIFNFSCLSLGIMKQINTFMKKECIITLGELYFNAASQHLYKEQFEIVSSILSKREIFTIRSVDTDIFDSYDEVVEHLWNVAKNKNCNPNPLWLGDLFT
jgi:thymidylate synthase